jgi:hypothetical protein
LIQGSAELDELAGAAIGPRVRAPADAIAGLEHHDRRARVREIASGREPGESGPDDHGVEL